jgi:hypothetical protein
MVLWVLQPVWTDGSVGPTAGLDGWLSGSYSQSGRMALWVLQPVWTDGSVGPTAGLDDVTLLGL